MHSFILAISPFKPIILSEGASKLLRKLDKQQWNFHEFAVSVDSLPSPIILSYPIHLSACLLDYFLDGQIAATQGVSARMCAENHWMTCSVQDLQVGKILPGKVDRAAKSWSILPAANQVERIP